jgi:hypothetical protein
MELLIVVSIKVTLWPISSPQKSESEIFSANSWDYSFDGVVLVAIPKSYLDASHTKPWLFTTLNESFRSCITVSCILAQLTKI